MKYWLNLYTWNTWQEFLKSGSNTTGFRESRWNSVKKIEPDDYLICYMTGISRYFAVQQVTSAPYKDETPIWNEAIFPCRVDVEVKLALQPIHAVPVKSLRNELSYFQNMKSPHSWTGSFRSSPTEIAKDDALVILQSLENAENNPVKLEFDERKLDRAVPTFETKRGVVSIPDDDNEQPDLETQPNDEVITHEEIQWLLLDLGAKMKMDVWVASNDRNKSFNGFVFSQMQNMRNSLPIQFDAATNRTIELIDVLWMQNNTIVAAFEIEHTTAVYSGLLRMADLITMQPNINIPLYIVAPDDRHEKVQREINRPIFSKALSKPLPEICQYIPYSTLRTKVRQAQEGGFLPYLRADFLDEISESVQIDDI